MNQGNQNPMPTPEMQSYFDSLPAFVQENIMQSGAVPATLADLQDCSKNILQQGE